MRKLYLLISLLVILFLVFLHVVFSPKNYILNYTINNFKITEEYQKKNGGYFYTINYQDKDYPIYINKKYTRKRKHIKNVTSYEEKDEICLVSNISNETKIICTNKDNLVDVYSTSQNMLNKLGLTTNTPEVKETYQNINIYDKNNRYIIWNYKGFYQLNNEDSSLEKLFNKDNYQNNLTYQTDEYLIFPDYDSEYFFTKLYIYDINKKTLKSITSDFEISYESYFLGYNKNKLYLIDKKERFEYEIDLKKGKFNIISNDNISKIIQNGEWKNVSLTKVINEDHKFTYNTFYNYYIENNTLYLKINNYPIKVSNLKVKQIVKTNGSKVYYLSEDKLYSYDYLDKEVLLLKYSEWNFNYANHIFIYD